jgi:hypothetical protein
MNKRSDTVIERTRVREMTGIFRSREALDTAVERLLLAGFDRSEIDVMVGIDSVRQTLGADYVAAYELPDLPHAPRQPYLAAEDFTAVVALALALLVCADAIGAAYGVLASGGAVGWAIAGAVACGTAAGAIGLVIVRSVKRSQEERFAAQMALGGLVLWVRVRSQKREQEAQTILLDCGADGVRVHEIEIDKRAEDLPLWSLRPDPWLGDERLGHP